MFIDERLVYLLNKMNKNKLMFFLCIKNNLIDSNIDYYEAYINEKNIGYIFRKPYYI